MSLLVDRLKRLWVPLEYEVLKSAPDSNGNAQSPRHYGNGHLNGNGARHDESAPPARKHVWVVAPPKSGSTWLTVLLTRLLAWQVIPLSSGGDRREQEISPPPVFFQPNGNIFSPHQHCRASRPTLDFLKQNRTLPIVLTRDIYDSIASMRDHLIKESLVWPMAYVDEPFLELGEEKQFDFIIAFCLPWYFNFYVSWLSAARGGQVQPLFISYEELLADTPAVLEKILRFSGELRSAGEINTAIQFAETQFTRKNQGVNGRGRLQLNERQKTRVREMRAFYSHMDFACIGLD